MHNSAIDMDYLHRHVDIFDEIRNTQISYPEENFISSLYTLSISGTGSVVQGQVDSATYRIVIFSTDVNMLEKQ